MSMNNPFNLIDLEVSVEAAVRYADRCKEYAYLAGEDDNTHKEAIEILEAGIRQLKAHRAHRHEWSEDCFCMICGADGNA